VKGNPNPKEALELGLRIGVLDQTSKRGLAIASVARVARREVVIEMAVDVIGIEAMEIELVKVVRGAIGARDEVGLKMLDPGEDHLPQVTTGVLRHEDEAEVTGKMIEIGGAGTMGETAREYGALRIRTATTSDRGLPEAYEKHSALATTTSSYFLTLSGLYIIRGDLGHHRWHWYWRIRHLFQRAWLARRGIIDQQHYTPSVLQNISHFQKIIRLFLYHLHSHGVEQRVLGTKQTTQRGMACTIDITKLQSPISYPHPLCKDYFTQRETDFGLQLSSALTSPSS
jgi:hypothetical protein